MTTNKNYPIIYHFDGEETSFKQIPAISKGMAISIFDKFVKTQEEERDRDLIAYIDLIFESDEEVKYAGMYYE